MGQEVAKVTEKQLSDIVSRITNLHNTNTHAMHTRVLSVVDGPDAHCRRHCNPRLAQVDAVQLLFLIWGPFLYCLNFISLDIVYPTRQNFKYNPAQREKGNTTN